MPSMPFMNYVPFKSKDLATLVRVTLDWSGSKKKTEAANPGLLFADLPLARKGQHLAPFYRKGA